MSAWNPISAAEADTSSMPVIIIPTNTQLAADADGDFVIGPNYINAPEMKVREGVPKGTIHEFTMDSTNSKIYPGIAKNQAGTVPYQRQVAVYVPQQYVSGSAAPFMVVQDGIGYKDRVATVLDNLISEHRLPAMIVVFINSGGGDAPRQ
ncbi:MAG: hypothetical protein WDM76_15625 [Limisphaerales bacterium]